MRALILTTLALLVAPLGLAQEESANPEETAATTGPLVTIEAIHVSPSPLRPDLLCRLSVDLKNDGNQTVSQLAFRVDLAGQEVPVYRNQIFMEPLAAGETTRVDLYNFWTTETGRSGPKGSEYSVEVSLNGAQWYRIQDIEEDGETIEEWTPLEAVPGLPSRRTLTLPWKVPGTKKPAG